MKTIANIMIINSQNVKPEQKASSRFVPREQK